MSLWVCLAAGGLFVFGAAAAASPWGRAAGDTFVVNRFEFNALTGAEGALRQSRSEIDGEVGLAGGWMLAGKYGYAWQAAETPSGAEARTGVSDAELFLQYTFPTSQPARLSVLAGAVAPTGLQPTHRPADKNAGRAAALVAGGGIGRSHGPMFFSATARGHLSLASQPAIGKLSGTVGRHRPNGRMWLLDAFVFATTVERERVLTAVRPGGAREAFSMGKEGTPYLSATFAPSIVRPLWGTNRLQIGGLLVASNGGFEGQEHGAGVFLAVWRGR